MISVDQIVRVVSPAKLHGKKIEYVEGLIQLDPSNTVDRVLMWVSAKRPDSIYSLQAGVIIGPLSVDLSRLNSNCYFLLCENPRSAFQQVVETFFKVDHPVGISESSKIHESVVLGNDIFVGEHVVIEKNCVIGDRCVISHGTVIRQGTVIGNDVVLGSNNVIGGTGFGYEKGEDGDFNLITHLGNVVIEDRVEIGSNSCIDRAVLGSTLIRKNVKIDNLVHIAHGVEIGENTLVIGCAQIAGSVKIGKNCWIAPSVTIIQKVVIGDNVTIGIGSVVLKSIDSNQVAFGNPCRVVEHKKV